MPDQRPARTSLLSKFGQTAAGLAYGLASGLAADLAACLRFYSRLPVPALPFEPDPHAMPDFSRVVRMLPVAGALIALVPALVLAGTVWLALPAAMCAGLALAASAAATGAFHEDGLADTADGFGGGATRERKLDIMKDSRIGTYGTVAVVLSLGLRWAALTSILAGAGAGAAAACLVGAGAASRTAALWPLATLPAARDEGAAWAAGKPAPVNLTVAAILAVAFCIPAALSAAGPVRTAAALALAALAGFLTARLASRQVGGQTGDVAGAAQQVAEIAMLASFSAGIQISGQFQ